MTAGTGIGAGLAPVRPPRRISVDEVVHVVGVAGAGASGAALQARASGATVSGCDAGDPSPYSVALADAGIPLAWSHAADHVTATPTPTRLAVTKALTAIDPDHPELAAARSAGIPVEPWQQVVADAASGRTLVGVAGTHGKSTTAGWLVHVLAVAGRDPSAFVGALLPPAITGAGPATVRIGSGDAFVVEADEYAGNFDAYRADVAVLTTLEWDHPDVFADGAAVAAVMRGWLADCAAGWPGVERDRERVLVANTGDPGVAALLAQPGSWPGRIVRVAIVDSDARDGAGAGDGAVVGRIVTTNATSTTVRIARLAGEVSGVDVRLPTAGPHNAANALCVAGAAAALGLSSAEIARGLESFPGVGRRLERKGEVRGVAVFDDYGHHPTAIRATIGAVRQREPGRRVWAVYEPLTYHRTAALHDAFADALATADAVAIARIWAGRDRDTTVDSAAALAASVAERRPDLPVAAPGDVDETAAWLASAVEDGDAVLVMGGGKSYRIAERLLELLEGD